MEKWNKLISLTSFRIKVSNKTKYIGMGIVSLISKGISMEINDKIFIFATVKTRVIATLILT